ncbi:MAG: nucleotidyltransferase [Lachnospiraceae bacterium]|nr:nucleotidyltransferase [Lachnospiraceae bacterium]
MENPVLVIMAAGMGSRYGGLKQIDPVDKEGNKIIDFSIYDAYRAGFKKVIFIIKKENEELFKEVIGNAVSNKMEVEYAFQDLNDVPEGFVIPEGRVKPWGTAHAIYCARNIINGPFAVINSDDYYGVDAFQVMYDFLTTHEDDEKHRFAMVGYKLENTLTENGYVSRGCCNTDEKGRLSDVIERTHIIKTEDGAAFSEDDGVTYTPIPVDTLVSMNFWGFSKGIMAELKESLDYFFENTVAGNPMKSECYIPLEVGRLLKENKATVEILTSNDKWFGVTYKEDKPFVEASIQALKDKGVYPDKLWS